MTELYLKMMWRRIEFLTSVLEMGYNFVFTDEIYFGAFCEPSKDMNQVRTMHANCCVGLGNKLRDLGLVLDDWKRYSSLPPNFKRLPMSLWRPPRDCSLALVSPQKSAEEVKEDVEYVEED